MRKLVPLAIAMALGLTLGVVGAALANHTANHDFPEANEACATGLHDGAVADDARGAICVNDDDTTTAEVYVGGDLDDESGMPCGEIWVGGMAVADSDMTPNNATAC